MSAAPIQLDRASKWYGLVLGMNEVTAEFGAGVTGLLGPNGAGKSTLMKLVCGMLAPSLGTVRVAGEDPLDNPSVLSRLGLCPEQDATYPTASILEVVTYLTRLQGFGRHDAKSMAQGALERVGLGEVLNRSATGFSKGMKQRAKLAQALAHRPDVLILDEPLNGLDPRGRTEMGDLIRELGDEGRTVLVSSHILHEVEHVASRVLLLYSGRLLADGTVAEIRAELPEYPLTIRIETDAPHDMAERLIREDGILRVAIRDDGLEVVTKHPEHLFDRLANLSVEGSASIDGVVPVDEDLEAVFRYLTR